MIEIKDLLSRFSNILLGGEAKKDSIRKVIGGAIGLPINKDQIEIKDNIIYLNIKPIYKNEIFIKKELILRSLEEALGGKHPEDIR